MSKKFLIFVFLFCLINSVVFAQGNQNQPRSTQPPNQTNDIDKYGIKIQPDKRLIAIMVALEAAGFNPTPEKEASVFRRQVQADLQNLNPALRQKLKDFLERNNKTHNRNTPAAQSAPFVSLAFALGDAPDFVAPSNTEDLPAEVLEVLDFATLLREFYRSANLETKMPEYIRAHQAIGDGKRPEIIRMAKTLSDYLHTVPQTTYIERVKTQVTDPKNKKKKIEKTETVEHDRQFFVVIDLFAVPGTLNFRVIRDDYFAVVPDNVNPSVSDLRRGYLQYIFDPIVLKNAKDISTQRDGIKALLSEREKAGTAVSPDPFLAVTRSLVAAADARHIEFTKVDIATFQSRLLIDRAKTDADKKAIADNLKKLKSDWSDDSALILSEAYEKGAILSFYFADQLKGLEDAGFDVASSLRDIILSLDATKESNRLTQNADARKRALTARELRKKAAEEEAKKYTTLTGREKYLADNLKDVEELFKLKNYTQAKARLDFLQQEFSNDSRVFYYFGRYARFLARDASDDSAIFKFLDEAAVNFRMAILSATKDTDKALISLSHVALGEILESNDQFADALREYEEAIKIGNLVGSGYQSALAGKSRIAKNNK